MASTLLLVLIAAVPLDTRGFADEVQSPARLPAPEDMGLVVLLLTFFFSGVLLVELGPSSTFFCTIYPVLPLFDEFESAELFLYDVRLLLDFSPTP